MGDDGPDVSSHVPSLPAQKIVGGQKRKKQEMSEEELQKAAKMLIIKMQDAVQNDNESNKKGRPALEKMMLLKEVTKELRRIAIQHYFMENGGCVMMGQWIQPLPDGTYPNQMIVEEILTCLDNLQIQPEYLKSAKNLGRAVKAYTSEKAGIPKVMGIAKKLVDKWSRMIMRIQTTYVNYTKEEEEYYDMSSRDQYRKLRQKLNKIQQDAEVESEEDEDGLGEKKPRKRQKTSVLQEEGQEIVRGRAGIIMPSRNAFDFVEKPYPSDCASGQMTNKNSGHEKIKRTMNNLKRFSKMNNTNKKMQTVKIDL